MTRISGNCSRSVAEASGRGLQPFLSGLEAVTIDLEKVADLRLNRSAL